MSLDPLFRHDVLVYISGPISAANGYTVEENIADAMTAYWDCLLSGIPAFSPHAVGIYPTSYTIPYERWLEYDLAILDRCTHLLLLPRWRESAGAKKEREYADSKGIAVIESIADIRPAYSVVEREILRRTFREEEGT